MSIAKKDQRQPWFQKINAFHKLPTIVDEDITLFESETILRYQSNKFLEKSNIYYPRDNPNLVAEIEELFKFYYSQVRFMVLPQLLAFYQGVYKFDMALYDHPKIINQVDGVLKKIDLILDGKTYQTSSKNMTVADILIFSEVIQLEIIGWTFGKYPNMWRWLKLMYENKTIWDGHEEQRETVKGIDEADPEKAKQFKGQRVLF